MPTFTPQQEKWIRSRPPAVEAVIRATPPTTCYRLKGNSGHYWISTYCEPEDDGPVTVKIVHLPDSYGNLLCNGVPVAVEVFGVDPTDLVPCGCTSGVPISVTYRPTEQHQQQNDQQYRAE